MVDYDNSEKLRWKARHPTIGVFIFTMTPAVMGAMCAVLVYGRDVDDARSAEKVSVAVDGSSNETQKEPKVVDPLRRRIRRFRVQNIPLGYVVQALNTLGVLVCFERTAEDQFHGYVDRDGVGLFSADRLISVDLENADVPRILDRLVAQHPLYRWVPVPGTSLINLVPKNSQLDFHVGPANVTGDPWAILDARFPGSDRLNYAFIRGHRLPRVTFNVPRCSAREFLNTLVIQYPGLTWRFYGLYRRKGISFVSFNGSSKPYVDEVVAVFPDVRKGTATNTSFRYELEERRVDGVRTLVVEKQLRVR